MKIGIDTRPLQTHTRYRGIGKHLEHLLTGMARVAPDNEYVFFCEKGLDIPHDIIRRFKHRKIIYLSAYYLNRIRFVRAFAPQHKIIKPKRSEVDVMLVSDGALGVPKNVPTVLVFHDIIPLLFKDKEIIKQTSGLRKYKRMLASKLYWDKYIRFLKNYGKPARLIAISEASRKDLHEYVPESKKIPLDIIHHGPPDLLLDSTKATPVKGLGKNDQFLLYVGGIDLRKNIAGLGKAFVELKKDYPKLKLVMVGKEFDLKGQLADVGWTKSLRGLKNKADVLTPGFVNDAGLRDLYERAAAFVFPSRYEGFGLPLLEAMQAGCPIICYRNSSIPEVAGDATMMLEDGAPLVPAISKLLDDKKLRDDLIKKGRKQVSKFSWDRAAIETLGSLEKAAMRTT